MMMITIRREAEAVIIDTEYGLLVGFYVVDEARWLMSCDWWGFYGPLNI